MSLHYLFIDMNSYFASVEQQTRPALRGRPVAVVPLDVDSTCCIAASYEAKRFGVKTGTRVGDAKRMCPGLAVVPARPELYIQMHHRIVKAVDACVPISAVLSIDEMACRLAQREQDEAAARALADRIKQSVRERVGESMRCSIGVAPNRLLAKVAADMEKPDGLTVIRGEELPGRLFGLKLTDLPGIGPRMAERLRAGGISTIEHLARLGAPALSDAWGSRVLGAMWWHTLRGHELPEAATRTRSVGHSQVLPPEWRNDVASRTALVRLLHKAAARLRHIDNWAGGLSLHVTYLGGRHWRERARLTPACQDTLTLLRTLGSLWAGRPAGRPLKVGVVLGELKPAENVTPSLFEPDRKLLRLAKAMDQVNRRFGRHSLYFAGMHAQKQSGSTRIAFHRIPDLELADA